MTEKAVRIVVTGRVQGVGYREWTRREGERHGLRGFMHNRRDGSVEAFLAGPIAAVDAMLAAMTIGPPAAAVAGVSAEAVDAAEAGDGGGIAIGPTR